MKKTILLIAFFLTCIFAKSQVYVGVGAGASTKAPVAELQIGVESNNVQVQGGFLAHLSNKVKDGASFYGKVSGIIHFPGYKIAPGIGYSYNLKSNDRKALNGSTVLFSVYGYKELEQGELFAGANYTDKTAFFTIGLRMMFE